MWDVRMIDVTYIQDELYEALANGWEPFSATSTGHGANDKHFIWLRKKVV